MRGLIKYVSEVSGDLVVERERRCRGQREFF